MEKYNAACPPSTMLLFNTSFFYAFAHSKNICAEPAVKPKHKRVSDLPKISWLISGTVGT